jgi:hypothetical protein
MIRNIRFFAEIRIDNIDLTGLRINETVPSLLIPVNAVEAGAKIVITDVGVDKGTFPERRVDGGEEMAAGDEVVEEK